MNENEFQRTIAKLRADYAAELPGTVAKMEELWRRLIAAEVPPSGLGELVRMAHSITGSGTTFGLPGASAAAGELEAYLDPYGRGGRLPGENEQSKVSALLAALRQAAAQT